ncbi:AbrB/MazE/SpoVT family DNA-binding domain-containing protein [Candidatus Woesearchaeota archaeon]|nr:AbrB/MazE/SpoVT family DNA-binding domain-containing protein [Candidatus Woesearchaeota archaeon]
MRVKTVKVSDKGQISLPVEVREEAGINKGDELLLISEGKKIFIEPVLKTSKKVKDDFSDLLKLSEKSISRAWSNADEIWGEYMK